MRLLKWRLENRYSQLALANMVGLKTGKSICDYENGSIPKPETIKKIEEVTKGEVKLQDFYS